MQLQYSYQNHSLNDLIGEKWENIPGLNGYYLISSFGRIKRKKREQIYPNGSIHVLAEMIMSPRFSKAPNNHVNDYTYHLNAVLKIGRKKYSLSVKRLVYYCFVEAFALDNRSIIIIPVNGNGLDIRPENLQMISMSEKTQRIYDQGRTVSKLRLPEYRLKAAQASVGLRGKKVSKYDKNGKLIQTYPSIIEAVRSTDIRHSSIASAASGRLCTAGGFYWCHGADPEFNVKTFLEERRTALKGDEGWKINQYNLSGKKLAEYATLKDAHKVTGVHGYAISQVLNGLRKSAGGWFWSKGVGASQIDLSGYSF